MNYRASLLFIALLGFVVLAYGQPKSALLNQQLKGARCGAQLRVFNAYNPNATAALNVRVTYGIQVAGAGLFVGQRHIKFGASSSYLNVPGGLVQVYVSFANKTTLARVQLYLQDGGMYTLAVTPFDPSVRLVSDNHPAARIVRIKKGLSGIAKPRFSLFEEDATPAPVGYYYARVYQVSLYNDTQSTIDVTFSSGSAKSFVGSLKQGDFALSAPLPGTSNTKTSATKVSVSFQVHGGATSVVTPASVSGSGFEGYVYDIFLYGNQAARSNQIPNQLKTSSAVYLPTQDRYGCVRFGPTSASSALFPTTLLELVNEFTSN